MRFVPEGFTAVTPKHPCCYAPERCLWPSWMGFTAPPSLLAVAGVNDLLNQAHFREGGYCWEMRVLRGECRAQDHLSMAGEVPAAARNSSGRKGRKFRLLSKRSSQPQLLGTSRMGLQWIPAGTEHEVGRLRATQREDVVNHEQRGLLLVSGVCAYSWADCKQGDHVASGVSLTDFLSVTQPYNSGVNVYQPSRRLQKTGAFMQLLWTTPISAIFHDSGIRFWMLARVFHFLSLQCM